MIRGALRRFLWFTVISAFAYGGGTTIAALCSYNSTIERKREKGKGKRKKKKREKKVRRGGQRSRVALPVYIAPYSQSPLTLSGVFLSFSRSPPFLCSRDRSLPSFILACFGTMRLRCANDRAADIGNYSLRNSRASPSSPLPSPLSLSLCAFVSYCPSLSFPPPSSFPRRFIFHPRSD